jgi:hypothetical protein
LEKNGSVNLAGSAENHLPMGAVKVLFGLESYDIAPAVFQKGSVAVSRR